MITRSASRGSYLSLIVAFGLAVMPAQASGQERQPQRISFSASDFGPSRRR